MTANALTLVLGNKLSRGLSCFVSCLEFCLLLVLFLSYFLYVLFAHLSETEKHKYLMAMCFLMSQGIRNKSSARKKVKIKIVNYRGQKKT